MHGYNSGDGLNRQERRRGKMNTRIITQEELDQTSEIDKTWRYPGVTGPGCYTWSEAHHSYYPVQQNEPSDFDSGLGRHEEKPIAATAVQIGRMEAQARRERICRRCGQSDIFDGAMFTTGGGNICDDCF